MKGEQGRAIEWGWIQVGSDRRIGYQSNVDKDDVIRCLKDDAADSLPFGSRFEIRQRHPTNYGRSHGMAWYRSPEMDRPATWGEGTFPRYNEEGGYLLIAQEVTPDDRLLPTVDGVVEL